LMGVPTGRDEAERRPVSDVPLGPPATRVASLNALHGALKIFRAPGSPPDVSDAGPRCLGQLQAVVRPLSPTAQVDGLPLSRGLVQPQDFSEEAERVLRTPSEYLEVRDG